MKRRDPGPPFLIAIVGGSCAGKTTLARRLRDDHMPNAPIIAEDDYYRCASTIPNFDAASYNFDVPEAKEHALLIQHLTAFRARLAFDKPRYDFATHTRAAHTERVEPAHFLIAEGLHLLTNPDLRALFDLKVFIDTPEDNRLGRRILRDAQQRARSEDSIIAQFRQHVAPMHALYVAPQWADADLVIRYDPARTIDEHALEIARGVFQMDD